MNLLNDSWQSPTSIGLVGPRKQVGWRNSLPFKIDEADVGLCLPEVLMVAAQTA